MCRDTVGVDTRPMLITALDEGNCSASHPGCLNRQFVGTNTELVWGQFVGAQSWCGQFVGTQSWCEQFVGIQSQPPVPVQLLHFPSNAETLCISVLDVTHTTQTAACKY